MDLGALTQFFISLLTAFLVGVILLKWLSTRATKTEVEAWRRAAERLGASFSEHAASSARNGMALTGEVGGARIWALLAERRRGNGQTTCTEVQATASCSGLRLVAYRRRRLAPAGIGVAGVRTFATGDEAFDARYVVKTNDETLARAWLDAEARALIMAAEPYAFVIEDCGVRAVSEGVEGDDERLVRAAVAAAALARGGLDLLETIREVGEALGGETSQHANPEAIGGFEITMRLPDATILFDLVHQERGTHRAAPQTWTRLRAETSGKHAPFVAVHADAPRDALEVEGLTPFTLGDDAVDATHRFESADPEATGRRLDAALRRRIAAASPTVLADDGAEITILQAGVEVSPETLTASVELILALAAREAAPYR